MPDQRRVKVRIALPNGAGHRVGWHEPWRGLLVWGAGVGGSGVA